MFVSGIIALTLSPMMCSKMLKANEQPGKFESTVHHLLDRMTARYDSMLHAVMQRRIVVILFAVIVFGSLPLLFKFIPSELAPSEDKGSWPCWGRHRQCQPGLHREHHGGREQGAG